MNPRERQEAEERQRAAKLEAAELEDLAWYAEDAEETAKAKRLRARARKVLREAGL